MIRKLTSSLKTKSQKEDRESYGTSRHLVEIIKGLINTFEYESFLEIGTFKGFTTEAIAKHLRKRIRHPIITTIDPKQWVKLPYYINQVVATSDGYFEKDSRRYDLILIDGDHSFEAARRDLKNSLARLTPHGTIVKHDLVSCSGVSSLMRQIDKGLLDVINFEYQVGISLIRFSPLMGPINAFTAGREEFVDGRLTYIRNHQFSNTSQIMADILLSWVLPSGQPHKTVADAVSKAEEAFRNFAISMPSRNDVADRTNRTFEKAKQMQTTIAPIDLAYAIEELLLLEYYFESRFGEALPSKDSIRSFVLGQANFKNDLKPC